jgi:hypothetical protein
MVPGTGPGLRRAYESIEKAERDYISGMNAVKREAVQTRNREIDRMARMTLGLNDLRELFSYDIENVRLRRTSDTQ